MPTPAGRDDEQREEREREPGIFSASINSPPDPLRIDEVYSPSQSTSSRTAWLSLSTPLQGTSQARIVLPVSRVWYVPVRSKKREEQKGGPKVCIDYGYGLDDKEGK